VTEGELVVETAWAGLLAYAPAVRRGAVEAVFTRLGYEGLNALRAGEGWDEDDVRVALRWRPELPALFHVVADERLERLLVAEGLLFYEEEPGMVASTEAPHVPAVRGLAIEQPSDLEEFVAVWTGSRRTEFRRRLAELRSRPAFEHLLGRVDGEAVATAAVFHGEAASEIQHVVTAVEYRRRGIATAMTAGALELCRRRGRELAVLTSSPDGERVYERLGFRRVCSVRRYLRAARA
jgi:ribosomal protein S18 acetylase RimI-like enzyme